MKEKFLKFPQNFLWGTATSAYQVEGGIKNNDWECQETKKAGRACNHYYFYEKDFDILKKINQNAYRFSIEWSRIEPKKNKFDYNELKHYQSVIFALKKRDIVPFITLCHFTTPIWFYKEGGWLNKKAADYFADYVEFVIKNLGIDVKFWLTINEPLIYVFWYPPLRNAFSRNKRIDLLDIAIAIKNLIFAHKKAYKILHKYGSQGIQIGLAKNNIYFSYAPGISNKILKNLAVWFWNKLFINLT
ncbi:glycoside hydrolase family 1 protein, partial [bacterium]|nr:glycoside hydrolase family 1 protein [bacterium]